PRPVPAQLLREPDSALQLLNPGLTLARLRFRLTFVTPENPSLAPVEPPPMSEFSRLGGVLFEPGKTFQEIGGRPRWLVPLLLVILSAVTYNYCFGQHVGWERFFRQQ